MRIIVLGSDKTTPVGTIESINGPSIRRQRFTDGMDGEWIRAIPR